MLQFCEMMEIAIFQICEVGELQILTIWGIEGLIFGEFVCFPSFNNFWTKDKILVSAT